jgi:hypothetical protein
VSRPEDRPDLLDVESELCALTSNGLSRTQATEMAIERDIASVGEPATVVVVEGLSDQIALEILAAHLGRNLQRESVAIVPMGGGQEPSAFPDPVRATGEERQPGWSIRLGRRAPRPPRS